METLISEHWHHLEDGEVVHLLKSDRNRGLDLFEIKHRQEHFGPNALTAIKKTSPLLQFLLQFHQPLVYILLVAGAVTGFLGEWVDAGVILGVVLVNAAIGFIQESKAVKAIEALAKTIKTETTVIREGKRQAINAAEIVPGDIVLLQSGDKAPADMRLLHVKNLQVDESALTGESVPVQKTIGVLPNDTMLAERKNMAYTSTLVTYGQGTGVVVGTGDKTEIGKISQLISEASELETPLTKKIARFSLILLFVIIGLAGVTFAIGVLRGQSAFEMFMAAVALAVGAIPEGLPAALTITLAIGVSRMAKRNAIIRKLPAVETLGSTTVICSDKTGTLTENKMTVVELFAAATPYSVTGTGYDSTGTFILEGEVIVAGEFPALRECLLAGLLCNDSALTEKNGVRTVEGDPTEAALIVAAEKAGMETDSISSMYPRIDSIPFESQYQYMATLHRFEEGTYTLIYMKGAVETVLSSCDTMLDQRGNTVEINDTALKEKAEEMASRGLRVLAFARKHTPANLKSIDHEDLKSGLTFIGLQAMIDPPRQEAIRAIQTCHNAGISVKMITGDHVLTARAIAKQIGLFKDGSGDEKAMTGEELEALCDADLVEMDGEKITAKPGIVPLKALCDADLVEMADVVNVFARVTPDQKLRLVESLQTKNNVVAMTGDGVNDAPALKQANIGIAMGVGGTEVAKEASDMVLTDDNFASIEAAVEEGRGVFDNLTKFITWTLPTNLGEGLVILAAIFAGVALPILPLQILWINMTTAVLLGLMLAFEPKEPDIMKRSPRDPSTPLLTGGIIARIFTVSLILLAGAFGLFEYEIATGAPVEKARTVAVNVFVLVELFYLFNCRSLKKSAFSIGFFSNPILFAGVAIMVILQILFTYLPLMNRLFHSAPLPVSSWFMITALGAAAYLIIEGEKWLRRRTKRPAY